MTHESRVENNPTKKNDAEKTLETFLRTLPHPDRKQAILNAQERKNTLLLNNWLRERRQLPSTLIEKHDLSNDLSGWEKYLHFVFEDASPYEKEGGFTEWSIKYITQMLDTLASDEQVRDPKNRDVQGSFFDAHRSGIGRDPEVWQGKLDTLDPESILAHSIHPYFLEQAVRTEVVGRYGKAWLSLSENRVVEDRGYVIIFQANEILSVGYPLLRINIYENEREWRSALPIDLNLARAILPTSEFPDRENASKYQFATSYFGEEFLQNLPRLK